MRNYKKTMTGFLLITGLLIVSLLYPLYGDKDYNEEFYVYDENGAIIDRAPTPPTPDHPLGTDRNGQDLVYIHLYGAKFTIAAVLVITIARILLGVFTGIVIALWLPPIKVYFKDFFIGFRYIPGLIIVLFLMAPVTGRFTGMPVWTAVTYQICVLTLVAYPAIVLLTIEFIEELQKKSFVLSSYLMGGSRLHVLVKHIWPFLKSTGLLLIVQQMLGTLVMIMHLGIFEYFLGGRTKGGIFTPPGEPPVAETLSNEWGGLIGQNFRVMMQYPWIVLSTMLFFFFLIAIMNMMKKELEGNLAYENIDFISKIKKKQIEKKISHEKDEPALFRFIKEEKQADI
jgi:peptide/nickel transport system permease protein